MTVRCFRETFSGELLDAGFDEAITPFVSATVGFDPLMDHELDSRPTSGRCPPPLKTTPQFIGKDPAALRDCLERVRGAGYETADLNCGCPFPMVRNKGRGSGLLRTPDVLRRMLEVGCTVMGEGRFSIKARLGIERNDELLALMPMINCFPLRFMTVHARNAKQMYEGVCDRVAFDRIAAAARVPIVYNGDADVFSSSQPVDKDRSRLLMVGRGFLRHLGSVDNTDALLVRYLDASVRELSGDHSVLGRMKELIAYWKDLPFWRRRWSVIKLARTVPELRRAIG